MKRTLWIALSIILLILFIDQYTKIYVKTHFILGESVEVFSWFRILFIENEGAAWGMKIPGIGGKLALSFFRIIAVGFIGYWLYIQIKKNAPLSFIFYITFIFAGALGNILDSIFYGVIFGDSHYKLTTLFAEKPYGRWFQGRVVDMISIPIINTVWSDWIPYFGGRPFRFFEYVFNVSDLVISIGGIGFLIFHRKRKIVLFKKKSENKLVKSSTEQIKEGSIS